MRTEKPDSVKEFNKLKEDLQLRFKHFNCNFDYVVNWINHQRKTLTITIYTNDFSCNNVDVFKPINGFEILFTVKKRYTKPLNFIKNYLLLLKPDIQYDIYIENDLAVINIYNINNDDKVANRDLRLTLEEYLQSITNEKWSIKINYKNNLFDENSLEIIKYIVKKYNILSKTISINEVASLVYLIEIPDINIVNKCINDVDEILKELHRAGFVIKDLIFKKRNY